MKNFWDYLGKVKKGLIVVFGPAHKEFVCDLWDKNPDAAVCEYVQGDMTEETHTNHLAFKKKITNSLKYSDVVIVHSGFALSKLIENIADLVIFVGANSCQVNQSTVPMPVEIMEWRQKKNLVTVVPY